MNRKKFQLTGHRIVFGGHPELTKKLRLERSNIFEWLVKGTLRWLGNSAQK